MHGGMQDFKRLVVWQKAHGIALDVCSLAVGLPMRYVRIADQMIGASTSIPGNLAEGCGRRTAKDQARFFDYAAGSSSELEAFVLIVRDLGLMTEAEAERLCDRIQEARAMILALILRVRAHLKSDPHPSPHAPTRRSSGSVPGRHRDDGPMLPEEAPTRSAEPPDEKGPPT